ncbi:glutaredoxin family protein [Deinococcus cavernae]|uniref:Glutaredoxin family protein n=1 Tax=Deinococcus cavernae TaxID=2320857 RepID=A0A418VAN7_9DEIO|nr:glutaredoxin family protein [Deinococcus cavernae]RJF73188.1 glutaredoxin family protein [Deinococcus cavernae]
MLPLLTLYGRAGCHLCEVAAGHLYALNFTFVEVDISGDDALEERYGFDIPVLTHGEQLLMKGRIDRKRLGLLKLVLLRQLAEG